MSSGGAQDLPVGFANACQDPSRTLSSHDPPTFSWALRGGDEQHHGPSVVQRRLEELDLLVIV